MSTAEPATVLLVEDDALLAADLVRALSEAPLTVWHAETGADARAILRQRRPSLIILDLTLPDVDGLVFCTQLRVEAPDVPFMICSTGTTAERVLAFKLGAEDFLPKPFDLAELEVRVEAILRRTTRVTAARPHLEPAAYAQHPTPLSPPGLGRLRVDVARWRVTLDDRPLNLTPTEFQLLAFMARRPGEIISRQELAEGVWGDASMTSSRTIDAYLRRLSSKLGGSTSPCILSIRGLGYQLAIPRVTAA